MNDPLNLTKHYLALTLTCTLLLTACASNSAASTALTINTPIPPAQNQATAIIPATLAPTPTQFQPGLIPQADTSQSANPATFETKQMAGPLAVVPITYEWFTPSETTPVPAGFVYLAITLSLENTSTTDAVEFSPAQISLIDSDGNLLNATNKISQANTLTAQTLKPGTTEKGVLVYQIPNAQQNEVDWNLLFIGKDNTKLRWLLVS
jgi:Domain of unknown function (DUF4352)